MRHVFTVATGLAGFFALSACSNTDTLSFTTSSEIAISADPATAKANVGYDRTEIVITPSEPSTGEVPPVFALLDNSGSVFNPQVRQVYATGNAARLATGEGAVSCEDTGCSNKRDRRILVFGTATNVGFNAGFASEGLPHVALGFKRRESSQIPLPPEGESLKTVSSVIAAIDTRGQSGDDSTGLTVTQFIATGDAAHKLAQSNCVRIGVKAEAAIATTDGDASSAEREELAKAARTRLSKCLQEQQQQNGS